MYHHAPSLARTDDPPGSASGSPHRPPDRFQWLYATDWRRTSMTPQPLSGAVGATSLVPPGGPNHAEPECRPRPPRRHDLRRPSPPARRRCLRPPGVGLAPGTAIAEAGWPFFVVIPGALLLLSAFVVTPPRGLGLAIAGLDRHDRRVDPALPEHDGTVGDLGVRMGPDPDRGGARDARLWHVRRPAGRPIAGPASSRDRRQPCS